MEVRVAQQMKRSASASVPALSLAPVLPPRVVYGSPYSALFEDLHSKAFVLGCRSLVSGSF